MNKTTKRIIIGIASFFVFMGFYRVHIELGEWIVRISENKEEAYHGGFFIGIMLITALHSIFN